VDAVALDDLADRLARVVWASSLTRLLQLLGQPEQGNRYALSEPWAILTAFRPGDELADNRQLNRRLKAALEAAGLSCYVLVGHWLEAPEGQTFDEAQHGNTLVHIREEALFCRSARANVEIDQAVRNATKATGQYAMMVSDGHVVWIRTQDGSVAPVGADLTIAKLEDAYRKMRGQREHPFAFV
jgi:hypothetical protein